VVGYQVLRKLADGSAAEVFLASAGAAPSCVVLVVIRCTGEMRKSTSSI